MRILIAILTLSLVTGCTVHMAFTDPPPSMPGSEEVPVETFQVNTFDVRAANAPTSYGQEFTEGLKDFILDRSAYQIQGSGADLRITGTILAYDIQPISVTQNDIAAQNRLTIRAKVELSFPKDPKRDLASGLSRFADFDSNQDLAAVEAALIEEINEQLFQDVLNLLRPDW